MKKVLLTGDQRENSGYERSCKDEEINGNKVFDDLTEGIMDETDVLARYGGEGISDGSDNVSQLTEKPMSTTSENTNCQILSSIPRNM